MNEPTKEAIKKKIIHVITTLDFGGAEKQLCLLAKIQAQRGLRVTVIFLKSEGSLQETLIGQGVSVESKFANKNPFFQLLGLFCYLKKVEPYIVHAHLPRAELISAIATFAQRRLVLVCSKHNSERFWPSGWRIISRLLSLFVQQSSSGIIFISNSVKKFFMEEAKECKDSKNMDVIYYGYSRGALATAEPYLTRPKKGVLEKRIITVARLVPQKNLENLILALSLGGSNLWCLDIFGSGKLETSLRNLISSLGLEGRVRLMGKTTRIDKVMGNYDVFVLPSKYEGLGLAMLEAIDCEIPIAASSIGAFIEILGNDYPYFFKYDETISISRTIQELVSHDKIDRRAFALAKLKKFDPNVMEQRVMDFYNLCLSDTSRAG